MRREGIVLKLAFLRILEAKCLWNMLLHVKLEWPTKGILASSRRV